MIHDNIEGTLWLSAESHLQAYLAVEPEAQPIFRFIQALRYVDAVMLALTVGCNIHQELWRDATGGKK